MLPSFGSPLAVTFATDGWGSPRSDHFHEGLDLRAPIGTPVYAMASGTVIRDSADDTSGEYLGIDHGGIRSDYMHLSQKNVRMGDKVSKGQLIGLSGNTGIRNSAPHLHLQVKVLKELLPEWISSFGSLIGGEKSGWYAVPAEPIVPVQKYEADVTANAKKRGITLYQGLAIGTAIALAAGSSLLLWFLLRRK